MSDFKTSDSQVQILMARVEELEKMGEKNILIANLRMKIGELEADKTELHGMLSTRGDAIAELQNDKPAQSWTVQNDPVSNPRHYNNHPSGVECITITEHMNFNLGNVVKYVWRNEGKGGIEDLKKAAWYLDREIKRRLCERSDEFVK